jgi:hypothetical protein
MIRRFALATSRTPLAMRATLENTTDPYVVDHIDVTVTQEDLKEELGYNKSYLDYTDECSCCSSPPSLAFFYLELVSM